MRKFASSLFAVCFAIVICCALLTIFDSKPAHASWTTYSKRYAKSLGYAVYNPTTEKTLSSTPTSGVTLPTGTKTITVCVENAPVRYFFGSTAVTGTLGLKLDVGCYTMEYDPNLIAAWRFINDSSGASTVTVEYYGQL